MAADAQLPPPEHDIDKSEWSDNEHRVWNALEAGAGTEQEANQKEKTLRELTSEVLGDISDNFLILLFNAAFQTWQLNVEKYDESSGVFLVFLAGVTLGRQLGVAEGNELPRWPEDD